MATNIESRTCRFVIVAIVVGFEGLRYLIFYPLLWMRIIIVPLTHLCAALGFIGLCLAFLMIPDMKVIWKLGAFSFGAFMLGWVYDGLLLLLSPQPLLLSSGRE